MCPRAGALDGHTVSPAQWGEMIAPLHPTLAREWRALLCPDHTAWPCSGLGIEFLPLKLPGRVSLSVTRRPRRRVEEVTQSKGGGSWRRLSGEAKRTELGGEAESGSTPGSVSCCWEVRLSPAAPWALFPFPAAELSCCCFLLQNCTMVSLECGEEPVGLRERRS